jgi:hypothetical protein
MELRRTTTVPVDGLFQGQPVPIPIAQRVTHTCIVLQAAPFLDRTAVHQVRTGQQNPVPVTITVPLADPSRDPTVVRRHPMPRLSHVPVTIIALQVVPFQVRPVVPQVRMGPLNRVPVGTAALQVVPFPVPGAIQAILLVVASLRMRQMKNSKHVRCL